VAVNINTFFSFLFYKTKGGVTKYRPPNVRGFQVFLALGNKGFLVFESSRGIIYVLIICRKLFGITIVIFWTNNKVLQTAKTFLLSK
jgi:hypothetical protein